MFKYILLNVLLIIFFAFLPTGVLSSQDITPDSLIDQYYSATNDSSQVMALREIVNY